MNRHERIKAYKQITDYYGEKKQCLKAIEECNELSQALCKLVINRLNYNDWFAVKEEIVDVIVVCEQLVEMINRRHIHINIENSMQYKIERTLKRINEDKNK